MTPRPLRLVAIALAGAAALAVAQADEHASRSVPLLPRYQQECSACHIAYPPGMLPAPSWQRIMNTLPKHYGTDASLDAATTKELAAWLAGHAGTYKRVSEPPPNDRITQSQWFIREHREMTSSAFRLPAVRSASNCAACHTQADQGDFNEHRVRIPR